MNNDNPWTGKPLEGMKQTQQTDPWMGKPLKGMENKTDILNAEMQTGSHDQDGLCEQAVEKWNGLPKMGTTANDAFNNFSKQGKASFGIQGIQPGDLLYFQPNSGNEYAGHAGVFKGYDKKGQPIMISATDQGVREDNILNWHQNIAPIAGYVHL